jgi:hypothetical protein
LFLQAQVIRLLLVLVVLVAPGQQVLLTLFLGRIVLLALLQLPMVAAEVGPILA